MTDKEALKSIKEHLELALIQHKEGNVPTAVRNLENALRLAEEQTKD